MTADYCVYVLSCLYNGKRYIGSTYSPQERKKNLLTPQAQNTLIREDRLKYGKHSFVFDVIEQNLTEKQARELESKLCLAINPEYNRTPDGQPRRWVKGRISHGLDRELIAQIRETYKQTGSSDKTAKLLDIGKSTVQRHTKDLVNQYSGGKFSQEKKDRIRQSYKETRSSTKTAKLLGVSETTVKNYTRDLR